MDDRLGDDISSKSVEERLAILMNFVNGDIRSDKIQHACSGCCRSEAEMVENIASAIWSAIFSLLGGEQPSKNRWGSMSKHLSLQVAGHLLHNVLNRVLMKCFLVGHPLTCRQKDMKVRTKRTQTFMRNAEARHGEPRDPVPNCRSAEGL